MWAWIGVTSDIPQRPGVSLSEPCALPRALWSLFFFFGGKGSELMVNGALRLQV